MFDRVKKFTLIFALASLLPSCTIFVVRFKTPGSHFQNAQELEKRGEFQAAIEEYEQHLKERLYSKSRPTEENPYFYHLIIGDLYLKLENPSKAEQFYISAKNEGVDNQLTADRLRTLARYWEHKGDIEKALKLLHTYRNLDPLLFDFEIDRLYKKQIYLEDQLRESPSQN